MASRSKDDLNEILVTAYEKACEEYLFLYPNAPQPFITCTYRSPAEQDELYEIGRSKSGSKITNARGGESPHNYRMSAAFDIAFVGVNKKLDWSKSNFRKFADIIVKWQPLVVCGIDFKSLPDAPHFELKDWKKYVDYRPA